jgi:hypothetical protein
VKVRVMELLGADDLSLTNALIKEGYFKKVIDHWTAKKPAFQAFSKFGVNFTNMVFQIIRGDRQVYVAPAAPGTALILASEPDAIAKLEKQRFPTLSS